MSEELKMTRRTFIIGTAGALFLARHLRKRPEEGLFRIGGNLILEESGSLFGPWTEVQNWRDRVFLKREKQKGREVDSLVHDRGLRLKPVFRFRDPNEEWPHVRQMAMTFYDPRRIHEVGAANERHFASLR